MDELLQLIYPEASEYVDWHTLLVTLAQPYPIPSTQDLLNALERYRMISNGDVLISRDQYDKVHNLNTEECFCCWYFCYYLVLPIMCIMANNIAILSFTT